MLLEAISAPKFDTHGLSYCQLECSVYTVMYYSHARLAGNVYQSSIYPTLPQGDDIGK